ATADGRLLYADVEIVLDGGAYTSSTMNVTGNAASLGVGPYEIPNIRIDAYGVYTNNPPCGAMRGFGAVQACFAYEPMMDRPAAATPSRRGPGSRPGRSSTRPRRSPRC